MSTDEKLKNGQLLDAFEDAWDNRPIKVKRVSAVPVVRGYIRGSAGLRRAAIAALIDEDDSAGSTGFRKARAVEAVRLYDTEEGQNMLRGFNDERVWRAIDKVIKEGTERGFLLRGKVNVNLLLAGPRD